MRNRNEEEVKFWNGISVGGKPAIDGMGGEQKYYHRVIALGPIAYWPLWDNVGSSIAIDLMGLGNGVPSNVIFGETGIGDDKTSALFNGATGSINIYSTALVSAFDGDELTLNFWIKPDGDIWATSPNRRPLKITGDANNSIYFRLNDGSNDLVAGRTAATVTDIFRALGAKDTTAWQMATITVSLAANEIRVYLNGNQVGTTVVATGWSASGLTSTQCAIGAFGTDGSESWDGWLAHVSIFDKALTPIQVGGLFAWANP